jgi:ubiquinone/menaquinone biosynthesis C-methylase UbiE
MEIDQHKKQFGNQAENYSKYRRPYPEEVYELLFSLLPSGAKRVVDIACGTGKSTEPLAREGFEVIGIDHDPLMIEEARKQAAAKNLPIAYSVAEVENLPFEDQTFDLAVVGTAFHWFVTDKAVTEIKRVLRDGGLLFIFWTLTTKDVPEEDQMPGEVFQTYGWERVPQELRDLDYISDFLAAHGLKDLQTARLPFVYDTTVEERVGLQKSASSYELLSEENKDRFIQDLTAILKTKLGNRTHFTLEEEIQACYGFKA